MTIRIASAEDAADITAIYAPIVRETGISFEDDPPTVEEMAERISNVLETHPWLVLEIDGVVVAYAYATSHRSRGAYRWSCEVSVYVGEEARRLGAARRLYQHLFKTLAELGFANALAGITLPNEASIGFHEHMGFELIGIYPNVGFKNGAWRSVGWWNLPLQEMRPAPANPLPFSKNQQAFRPL